MPKQMDMIEKIEKKFNFNHPSIADEVKLLEDSFEGLPNTLKVMHRHTQPNRIFVMAWLKKIVKYFYPNFALHLPDIFVGKLRHKVAGEYYSAISPKGIIQISSEQHSMSELLETILHEFVHHICWTEAILSGEAYKAGHTAKFRNMLARFGIITNTRGVHESLCGASYRVCKRGEATISIGNTHYRVATEQESKIDPQPNFLKFLDELRIEYIPTPAIASSEIGKTKKNWKNIATEATQKIAQLEAQVEELKKQTLFSFEEGKKEQDDMLRPVCDYVEASIAASPNGYIGKQDRLCMANTKFSTRRKVARLRRLGI